MDFYYKQVAVVFGRYYSVYDGRLEYRIGETVSSQAQPGHRGGLYVYRTPTEAVYAKLPMKTGGTFLAPRTVLKVRVWGEMVEYPNGKLAFSNLLPVRDMGMPQGYLTTHAARRRPSSQQAASQSNIARMRSETQALEAEVAEMERLAARMGL